MENVTVKGRKQTIHSSRLLPQKTCSVPSSGFLLSPCFFPSAGVYQLPPFIMTYDQIRAEQDRKKNKTLKTFNLNPNSEEVLIITKQKRTIGAFPPPVTIDIYVRISLESRAFYLVVHSTKNTASTEH